MKQYFNLFDFTQKVNYKTEILAGLTVAMTMIPESLSFAILAGFPPFWAIRSFHHGISDSRFWW
jgi:SulP family sulfate permease